MMKQPLKSKSNFAFQQWIVAVGIFLFILKVVAWYFTQSVAILTDALESIVNIITGFIGLYSLYLSSLPKDQNHPYGHGKIEFLSAAIEGSLIAVAGILIIYESIVNLQHPHQIQRLDFGIILVAFTAVMNYVLGSIAVRKGKETKSLALEASGKHLKSDTYSTGGIVVGLVLILITGVKWLDSVVAFVFAGVILYTGYKILRDSIAGIMDEADEKLISEFVQLIQTERPDKWIDVHNLRIIKYGSTLHMDCHLTLPYYFSVKKAHDEVEKLDQMVNDHFGTKVELFVHTDPCMPYSCKICNLTACEVRTHRFEKQIAWTKKNISLNQKHQIDHEFNKAELNQPTSN